MKSRSVGVCYLVGAGPGDPGLLTLRGRECIEAAEVIVFDSLANPELLRWATAACEKIDAGKRSRRHKLTQDEINALLVRLTGEGKVVTRLKGGDPLIFGRGGEEAQALAAAGLAFEIVPGVSSAIAGPAYAGIPVTHRSCNTVLTLFTGHEDPAKGDPVTGYGAIAAGAGVKVMLMGVERLAAITQEMLSAGASPHTPVALVRWATTGRQQTLTGTLKNIASRAEDAKFQAPAVAVFGEVVRCRDQLNWFESRPLFGKRVVVTRTRRQASALSRGLRDLGADVIELPTIRIEPPPNAKAFAQSVRDAHTYNWLVFTSPNGAEAFFELFFRLYADARCLGGARIAAIGPGTARKIAEYRLAVDLQPEEYIAEGLVRAFEQQEGSIENLTFLWVRAGTTREVISRELGNRGAIVDEAVAYRTVPEKEDVCGGRARFLEEGADVVTFTSSSTVEGFFSLNLPFPPGLRIASIGPVTSEAVRNHGNVVDSEARTHDIPGLIEAVRRLCRKKPGV
ncbi:MAG TPA: uroporphyrinogen-III C-methyltransferase [Verrucomicrobiales bacterium]|nr:uroporphyrinogen-III C-methyltransferase [Verrucomicrobiales bacterium]